MLPHSTSLIALACVQAGGHYGTSPGYIHGNDDFRPRASIPFNLEVDSDDDSSVMVRRSSMA